MKLIRTAACLAALGLAVCTAVDARPPGGPGFGPGPGFRGPGWGGPPPPPRHHHNRWHDFGRDVLGGTLVLGLGLGLANAITNATTPTYTAPTYVAPSYVAPTYAAPTYTLPTYTAPVVTAPVVSAPVVTAPAVTAPVVTAPVVAAPVVTAPVVTAATIPGKTMYWCQASKNFYPYVTECTSGWEARVMP
ncbi:hypothetical protein [Parasutterella excrementihominis]